MKGCELEYFFIAGGTLLKRRFSLSSLAEHFVIWQNVIISQHIKTCDNDQDYIKLYGVIQEEVFLKKILIICYYLKQFLIVVWESHSIMN